MGLPLKGQGQAHLCFFKREAETAQTPRRALIKEKDVGMILSLAGLAFCKIFFLGGGG